MLLGLTCFNIILLFQYIQHVCYKSIRIYGNLIQKYFFVTRTYRFITSRCLKVRQRERERERKLGRRFFEENRKRNSQFVARQIHPFVCLHAQRRRKTTYDNSAAWHIINILTNPERRALVP